MWHNLLTGTSFQEYSMANTIEVDTLLITGHAEAAEPGLCLS